MDRTNPPLVEVTWSDCLVLTEWIPTQVAMDSKLVRCNSVGYLLAKDEESIIIAQSIAEDDAVSEVLCIPVSSVEVLRELV